MIFLQPRNGTCNRLRAIASALSLARSCGQPLCVYWVDDSGMKVKFTDLFVNTGAFDVVEQRSDRMERLFSAGNDNFFSQDDFRDARKVKAMVESISNASSSQAFAISSFSHFHGDHDYSWLRLKPDLQSQVDELGQLLGSDCIGLHIRRTDNVKSRAFSPLHLFEKFIREEMSKDLNVRFFLATDSDVNRRLLVRRFGNRIITREAVAARFERNGVADGVVDLMLLARTRKVIGCHWSSFSEEAARIGHVPFAVLKESIPDPEQKVADLNDQICELELAQDDTDGMVRECRAARIALERVQERLNAAQFELQRLKMSEAYRVGMLLTWPLRKIKSVLWSSSGR